MRRPTPLSATRRSPAVRFLAAALLLGLSASASLAQELEPRRWSHLPIDTNFLGGGYLRTEGDIDFDPVLQIRDAEVEADTAVLKYIRAFELLGHTARIEFAGGYQEARWEGLLDGTPASVSREGPTDSVVRFAVDLFGAPPLQGREYADYRATRREETIVGAGLAVVLPTGDYLKDKLLNIGGNRYVFRSQLGVMHTRDRWTFEATGAVWLFDDNDAFWNGNRLEQDPLYTLQTHLIYARPRGLWASASAGYGVGGETAVNGIDKDNRKENLVWALGLGYPLGPRLGIKAAWIALRPQEPLGVESDTFAVTLSTFW